MPPRLTKLIYLIVGCLLVIAIFVFGSHSRNMTPPLETRVVDPVIKKVTDSLNVLTILSFIHSEYVLPILDTLDSTCKRHDMTTMCLFTYDRLYKNGMLTIHAMRDGIRQYGMDVNGYSIYSVNLDQIAFNMLIVIDSSRNGIILSDHRRHVKYEDFGFLFPETSVCDCNTLIQDLFVSLQMALYLTQGAGYIIENKTEPFALWDSLHPLTERVEMGQMGLPLLITGEIKPIEISMPSKDTFHIKVTFCHKNLHTIEYIELLLSRKSGLVILEDVGVGQSFQI